MFRWITSNAVGATTVRSVLIFGSIALAAFASFFAFNARRTAEERQSMQAVITTNARVYLAQAWYLSQRGEYAPSFGILEAAWRARPERGTHSLTAYGVVAETHLIPGGYYVKAAANTSGVLQICSVSDYIPICLEHDRRHPPGGPAIDRN